MLASAKQTLSLASVLTLSATALVGCQQVQRTVVEPAEPTWTYRDGDTQLSNNDTWQQMIPTTAALRYDQSKVASVEEPTH